MPTIDVLPAYGLYGFAAGMLGCGILLVSDLFATPTEQRLFSRKKALGIVSGSILFCFMVWMIQVGIAGLLAVDNYPASQVEKSRE